MREKRGTVQVVTIESKILEGNLPGDPHIRDLHVYLPPGYDFGGDRYPVVWMLSGFTSRGRALLNDGPWAPGLDARMDALIASGKCRPMILAMPDCFTHLGGSQYVNSPALGRYEDHVIEELVPEVDRRFRTLPGARHRGIAGKSSGGYGALTLGMKHPDVFGAVACHSGDMAFDLCYTRDFGPALRRIRKRGGLKAWYEALHAGPRMEDADHAPLDIVAMAACYSPNPDAPPAYCDLPFDLETGAARPEVLERWLAFDPLRMAERYADNLRRLRLLFLDCGTDDEYYLELGARQLSAKLKALGVAHAHEEYPDGHFGVSYRYDVSLPRMSAALAP
ncbi:MAG TPA: alpha/beta hydrolase-fold protein [Candidatus Eisenbacteria bacterium]|nr:alpha/beta hydrolase-fold protein [Candidatus Eisenbacteria bacterium]